MEKKIIKTLLGDLEFWSSVSDSGWLYIKVTKNTDFDKIKYIANKINRKIPFTENEMEECTDIQYDIIEKIMNLYNGGDFLLSGDFPHMLAYIQNSEKTSMRNTLLFSLNKNEKIYYDVAIDSQFGLFSNLNYWGYYTFYNDVDLTHEDFNKLRDRFKDKTNAEIKTWLNSTCGE